MDLKLNRTKCDNNGCFGELIDDTGKLIAYTAEHAYANPDGSYSTKTPPGTYTCQRGQHQLESMTQPFTTFQIMNVPDHTNILIHAGNWPQIDSDGCCIIGEAITESFQGPMVTNSRVVFAEFMTLQDGINTFQLIISS
jgi:hypothetical protein